jgi:hypothetical protein
MGMDVIQFLAALATGGLGGAAAVTGLSRWLGDVWLGRILAREKAKFDIQLQGYKDTLERSKNLLQARIDSSVFVTRAHFETEFDAYKRVFEALAEVRLLMPTIHPAITASSPDETREDRLRDLAEKLGRLEDAHNAAVRIIENLSPFYPEDIFTKLTVCLRLARAEMLQTRTAGSTLFSPEWHAIGESRLEDFMKSYNESSQAIRARISTLAILPHE